jgi:hypothetical protein
MRCIVMLPMHDPHVDALAALPAEEHLNASPHHCFCCDIQQKKRTTLKQPYIVW